jgi:hypothetical protein
LGKYPNNQFSNCHRSSNNNKEATRACNCQEKVKGCLMSSRNSKQLKQTRSRATDEKEREKMNTPDVAVSSGCSVVFDYIF